VLPVLDVAQVRDAEAELLAALPDGALMHRASFGLAVRIAHGSASVTWRE